MHFSSGGRWEEQRLAAFPCINVHVGITQRISAETRAPIWRTCWLCAFCIGTQRVLTSYCQILSAVTAVQRCTNPNSFVVTCRLLPFHGESAKTYRLCLAFLACQACFELLYLPCSPEASPSSLYSIPDPLQSVRLMPLLSSFQVFGVDRSSIHSNSAAPRNYHWSFTSPMANVNKPLRP